MSGKMIIFNTTFHLDDDIHDNCLLHLRGEYIRKAIRSGQLSEPRLAHIHHQHEQGGTSYSLQFKVKDVDTLNKWMKDEGEIIHSQLISKFGQKVAGFITLLEEIEIEPQL